VKRILQVLTLIIILCTHKNGFAQRFSFLTSNLLQQILSSKTIIDNNGSLWTCNEVGISTFDGKNLVVYDETNGLNAFFNSDLDYDSQNNLWISSYGKGIIRFNGNTFSYYNTYNNFPANNVWESLITENNYYWGASQDHGLVHWRPGCYPTIVLQNNQEFKKIQTLAEDKEKKIWFGGESGLYTIEPNSMHLQQLLDSTHFVRDIWMDYSTTLILTKKQLFEYKNGKMIAFNNIYSTQEAYREVFKTSQGTIFITSKDFTTVLFKNGEIETWTVSNGLLANFVKDIYEDIHGFLWFGTQSGVSILPSENSLISLNIGDMPDEIVAFHPATDSTIYIAFRNSGLYSYKNKILKQIPGIEQRLVSLIPEEENLIVVGENYISHLNNGTVIKQSIIKRPVLNTINHVDTLGRGKYILSCQDGVHVFNENTGEYSLIDTSLQFYAMHSFKDKTNRWYLGLSGELYSSNNKKYTNRIAEINPQNHSNIFGYYSTYYKLHFFGSTGGLFIWNGKKIYDINKILDLKDGVYSITEDDRHIVWCGGIKNLLGLDIKNQKYYIYSNKDGIKQKINIYTLKCYGNKIYWASNNNIVIFDHEAAQRNKSKSNVNSIDISYVGYQGKVYYQKGFYTSSLKTLQLKHDENNLNIQLRDLNYYGNTIEYHYTLEGLEKYYNTSSNADITYTNLSPGNYTLKVYTTIDGVKTSEILKLKIFIDKPYWNKVWFYIIEILVVLIILGLTYYLSRRNSRISQIMIYFTIIMIFETIIFIISQRVDRFTGNIPIFQLSMNILLAVILLPVEQKIKWLIGKLTNKKLPS